MKIKVLTLLGAIGFFYTAILTAPHHPFISIFTTICSLGLDLLAVKMFKIE